MRRWRGLMALVHDAVDATTELVREGHDSTARRTLAVTDRIPQVALPARVVDEVWRRSTGLTLGSVRAVNRTVAALTELALDGVGDAGVEAPLPLRSDALGTPAWVADMALGAVNGAIGDHLAANGNGLDLGLALRWRDTWLPGPVETASGRIVVLVHGLATTEWSWCLDAEAYHGDPASTFGTLLARDLGFEPVYVRYNTGRKVAANGAALARALDALVRGWPVPVTELVFVGHSMGGLTARAACHAGGAWLDRVGTVVSLGTPHQGAPLARLGRAAAAALGAIDLPATRIGGRILDARSAGVRDLEHGDLEDAPRDPDATAAPGDRVVPLLDGVRYAFLSATVTRDPAHPVGGWLGDLMVRVESASGPRVEEGRFRIETETFGRVLHHQLQCHPDVYAQLRRILA